MLFCNNAVIPEARFSGAAVECYYANQYFLTGQELSCAGCITQDAWVTDSCCMRSCRHVCLLGAVVLPWYNIKHLRQALHQEGNESWSYKGAKPRHAIEFERKCTVQAKTATEFDRENLRKASCLSADFLEYLLD